MSLEWPRQTLKLDGKAISVSKSPVYDYKFSVPQTHWRVQYAGMVNKRKSFDVTSSLRP
jgi:hypothetical protein